MRTLDCEDFQRPVMLGIAHMLCCVPRHEIQTVGLDVTYDLISD